MRKRVYSDKEKDAVVAFYQSGMFISEIARTLKTSKEGVAAILDERQVKRLKVVRLTAETASEVAEVYLRTASIKETRRLTGFTDPTIYKVLKERKLPTQSELVCLKKQQAVDLYLTSGMSVTEICSTVGLSRASLYRELKKVGEQ